MLKLKCLILLFLMVLCIEGFAQAQLVQTVEISSSPNPVGSGARAMGMGGAFIGVADDATAASWNPAGLIQLETPEVSIVGAYNKRTEDTTYKAFLDASGPQTTSTYELNYMSTAYPFTAFDGNMIVSLNFQHLYDFTKKVEFGYIFTDTVGPPLTLKNNINFDQEGGFKSLSPAFAVQITPFFSVGIALNLWDSGVYGNKWESKYRSNGAGTFVGFPFQVKSKIDQRYEMKGMKFDLGNPFNWENANYNLGFLWNISPMWSLGGVFKAPFVASLRRDYYFESTLSFPTNPTANSHNVIQRSETVILDMPMSYGLGVAFRANDNLTIDLDAYRTEWGDYVLHDADGNELNPITGKLQKDSHISPTTQVRIGGEYLIIGESTILPIRAGVFYDPEPAEGSPDKFYGVSIGSGIVYKNIAYDLAYQYRFGRDVRSTTVGNADSLQSVKQHTIYMSVIYHF
jgi:long-subunit fatty acid transport protein